MGIAAVNTELQSLRPAQRGAPDPVSKLWPGHYSAKVQRQQEEGCTPLPEPDQTSNRSTAGEHSQALELKKRFPEFYSQYGYDQR